MIRESSLKEKCKFCYEKNILIMQIDKTKKDKMEKLANKWRQAGYEPWLLTLPRALSTPRNLD